MKIIQLKNNINFFDQAADLFNKYLKFYKQNSDIEKAKSFLKDRLDNNESEVFLAISDDGKAIGFM